MISRTPNCQLDVCFNSPACIKSGLASLESTISRPAAPPSKRMGMIGSSKIFEWVHSQKGGPIIYNAFPYLTVVRVARERRAPLVFQV